VDIVAQPSVQRGWEDEGREPLPRGKRKGGCDESKFTNFDRRVTLSDFRRKTYLVSLVHPQVAHVRCARLLMRIVSIFAQFAARALLPHILFFVSRLTWCPWCTHR
jgi:hypothetical protein